MKKSILFVALILFAFGSTSCSNDDNSGSKLNENAQKLIGVWGNDLSYKKFNFRSDLKVEYQYATGEYEIGDWRVNGDILTMEFPETVLIVYVQKLVFINNDTVEFVEAPGSQYEPWSGTYYRIE